MRLAPLFALLVPLWVAQSAHAEQTLTTSDFKLEEEQSGTGYWHAALLGGVVVPTDNMGQTHKEGLAANFRLGYTGGSGLGMAVAGTYAPLALKGADRTDSHLVLMTAAPRYTVGERWLRVWFGAGGGLAVERASDIASTTRTTTEPLAVGEGGAELHIFSGGGVTVQGNYARSFGVLNAQLVSLLGGLVFTFQ